MAAAVAAFTLAVLLAFGVTSGLDSLSERASAQLPTPSASPTGFRFRVVDDSVGIRPLTRVVVAAPPGALSPRWAPPGCAALPEPSRACVSPALRDLAARDPLLATRLGLRVHSYETMTDAGPRAPDDLVVFQGVSPNRLTTSDRADGWGAPADVRPPVSVGVALLELGLLVGLPALALVAVSSRLSSTTRWRRARALRLLGVSPRTTAFVASSEGRLAGLFGATAGCLAYLGALPAVADSGAAGFRWYPDQSRVSPIYFAVLILVFSLSVGALSRVDALRLSGSPTARAARRRSGSVGLWRLVPGWLAVLVMAAWLVLHGIRGRMPGGVAVMLIGGGVGVAGLLLALRPVLEVLAGAAAEGTRRVPARLAARRTQFDAASTVRVVTSLAMMVLVATIASSVLRDASLAAGAHSDFETLSIAASDLRPAERERVLEVPARAVAVQDSSRTTVAPGAPVPVDPGKASVALGVPIVRTTCANLLRLEAGVRTPCRDGLAYRVSGASSSDFPNDLPVGTVLHLGDGPRSTLVIPRRVLTVNGVGAGLLDPDSIVIMSISGPVSSSAVVLAQVHSDDAAIARYQDKLAVISPLAKVDLNVRNLQQANAADVHDRLIRFGVIIGFALSLIAALAATVDRVRERRRTTAMLNAVGSPHRALALANAIELTAPALVASLLATVVGSLVGATYLAAGGLQRGWYWPTLSTGLVLSVGGAVVAATLGALLPTASPPSHLRSD